MTNQPPQNPDDFLPPAVRAPDTLEKSAEVGAFATEIAGAIGGILFPPAGVVTLLVAHLLAGYADGRKFKRITDVIDAINSRITTLEGKSAEYVKSEEFIDLTEQVIDRATKEPNAEKRRIYGAFLADAIASPGDSYDEQLRFLRTLEQLQGNHIRILKAYMQPADPNTNVYMGSIGQTLERRLPGMDKQHIHDMVQQMADLRVIESTGLNTMMTGSGAEETRARITPYGRRFTKYLTD